MWLVGSISPFHPPVGQKMPLTKPNSLFSWYARSIPLSLTLHLRSYSNPFIATDGPFHIQQAPIEAVILFGLYSVATIIKRLIFFPECPAAADSLQEVCSTPFFSAFWSIISTSICCLAPPKTVADSAPFLTTSYLFLSNHHGSLYL